MIGLIAAYCGRVYGFICEMAARGPLPARNRCKGVSRSRKAREFLLQIMHAADYCEQAGDYQTALGFVDQALCILKEGAEQGDQGDIMRSWNLMFRRAALLEGLEQYDRALSVLDEMLQLQSAREAAGCPAGVFELARIKGRRCLIFRQSEQFEPALQQINEVLEEIRTAAGSRHPRSAGVEGICSTESESTYYLVIRGMIYYDLQRWDESRGDFSQVLTILRNGGHRSQASLETQMVAALFISSIMNNQHRNGEAIMHSTYALQLAREKSRRVKINSDLVAGLLYQRALAFQRSRRWKEALNDIDQARHIEKHS